jgi:hypothetical protein
VAICVTSKSFLFAIDDFDTMAVAIDAGCQVLPQGPQPDAFDHYWKRRALHNKQ